MPRPSVIDSVRPREASSVLIDLSREKETESSSYSCEYVSKRKNVVYVKARFVSHRGKPIGSVGVARKL